MTPPTSSSCSRISGPLAVDEALEDVLIGKPNRLPTAMAARALAAVCRPSSGTKTGSWPLSLNRTPRLVALDVGGEQVVGLLEAERDLLARETSRRRPAGPGRRR